jgi:restriction system protein
MARRRSFFAEMQHQAKVASRQAEQAQRARARQHATAVRQAEQAQRAAERAAAQYARAAEADRKRLEKEARDARVAAKQAEVNRRNTGLAEIYEDLDSLLASTLDVDDYVDLEALRVRVEHPPFPHPELEVVTPLPPPIPNPVEPMFVEPEPVKGLFGKKKKEEQARALAMSAYQEAYAPYQAAVASLPHRRQADADEFARAEQQRIDRLAAARETYRQECDVREAQAASQNAELDAFMAGLAYGATDAVELYVGIVLSNSVYPECFWVDHEYTFEPSTAELSLRCLVPGPGEIPTVKAYKYTKASDEITETRLSAKAAKDRYNNCIHQVSLRLMHEVFEADRRGVIKSIALEVGTETTDPATGTGSYVPLVAASADRETFMGFDLSAVVPSATLQHLGASVSKNPHGLVPAEMSGVRRA